MIFHGPDYLAATVFDLQNGSYDALALITNPGYYKVKVMLDYTQCEGLKDPPTEWYVKGKDAFYNWNAALVMTIKSNSGGVSRHLICSAK